METPILLSIYVLIEYLVIFTSYINKNQNNMFKLLLTLITLLSLNTFSQDITWQKSLGGSSMDYGKSIKETSDGGFIMAGYAMSSDGDITNAKGYYDYWIVKLNESGSKEWQKSLGGSGQDVANYISQTSDNGYIIAGYTISKDGDISSPIVTEFYKDYWIVKLNSSGTIQWEKSLGGSDHDVANYISQTNDGGYIICGNSKSNDNGVDNYSAFADAWVVKLNSSGNITWSNNYGGTLDDDLKYIEELSDGSFIAVGSSKSNDNDVSGNNGDMDAWIIKISSTGSVLWSKLFGGENVDIANSAVILSNGSFVFAGNTASVSGGFPQAGNGDYFVVKVSATGNNIWTKTYGGTGVDNAKSICNKNNGNIIIAGSSSSVNGMVQSNFGKTDYWILELNNNGDTVWTRNYGGSLDDVALEINQTDDGGFIIIGNSNSTNNQITDNKGSIDYWVVKLSAYVGINSISNHVNFDIYPNPAKNTISISNEQLLIESINIFDITGKKVKQLNINQNNTIIIDISELEKGVYFVKVTTKENLNLTKRLIIE